MNPVLSARMVGGTVTAKASAKLAVSISTVAQKGEIAYKQEKKSQKATLPGEAPEPGKEIIECLNKTAEKSIKQTKGDIKRRSFI